MKGEEEEFDLPCLISKVSFFSSHASASLPIILLFVAGIKEFYWIALIFMLICSVFIFLIFISTFFSPDALNLRKSGYKKNELN